MRQSLSFAPTTGLFKLIAAILCITGSCSFAQDGDTARPERGSIQFGSKVPPASWNDEDIARIRNVYNRIAKNVIPSVVSIIPTVVDTVTFYQNPFRRFFEDDPFGFNRPDEGQPPAQRQERRVQSLGSGFIVSQDGYILTNYHVIAGAREIEIHLADNRSFQATIAGVDSLSDVAVLKIIGDIPKDLPVAYLGDSDSIFTGDQVAAIGSPFRLTSSITSGIISALEREIGDMTLYQNFIQTDAAINPGNSGGPLVDLRGAVIGINTFIFSRTGGFMGIGFAIPINLARKVMEDLIYEGKVIRGWIGISVQELTPEARQALELETTQGVLVADVVDGQPADRAGIKTGDVLLSIDGQPIENANDLRNSVAAIEPGAKAQVELIRDGRKIRRTIQVIERTQKVVEQQAEEQQLRPQPQAEDVKNNFGIGVDDLTDENREKLGIPDNIEGVVVTRLAPGITDARATLQLGDIITRAQAQGRGWTAIRSTRDYQRFAEKAASGDSIILLIRRGNSSFYVPFTVSDE